CRRISGPALALCLLAGVLLGTGAFTVHYAEGGQCHVEYYFKGDKKVVTYPWHKGLKVEEIERYYDEQKFKDYVHSETGASVLKAQHPEFEMWNQGIHARSGVSCADCHMPYQR